MITTILWDVDGTLLDFLAAEKRRSGHFLQNSGSGNARMRRSPGIPKSTADTGKSWKTAS